MKITDINLQSRDKNRVNVFVDSKYRFSLWVFQLTEIGIKIGNEYDELEISRFESESQIGKIYGKALEYCLVRPRSSREIMNYLNRKTKTLDSEASLRIRDRLTEKGYINDDKFALFWVENRSLKKGISRKKLITELRHKGINEEIISSCLSLTERDDTIEIEKIINKKRSRYPDDKKLIAYLVGLGFCYDDIKKAIIKD